MAPGRSDVTALVVLILTLMADQSTKGLVTRTMSPGQSIPDDGFVRATYVLNTGSAFGLFPDQTLLLTLASLVGIGVLLFFYRTHPVDSFMLRLSLGLMLGGAMGNLIDRVRLGHVVDFIDVGAWPVFNIADSSIVVGLIGLLLTVTSAKSGSRAPTEAAAAFAPAKNDWTEQAPDAWFNEYNDNLHGAAAVPGEIPRPAREEGGSEVRTLVADAPGERLDRFLADRHDDLSRSHVAGLVSRGLVRVNGAPAKASYRLKGGETVEVEVAPPQPMQLTPQDIQLSVVYEDEDVLVVDKPAGMVVHPAPGHPVGTLVNALLGRMPELARNEDGLRPGIVHRLDRDTSGLMVVAKNRQAHEYVARQLKNRAVRKVYTALVEGRLEPPEGTIAAPIGRDPRNRKRMAVVQEGRDAETAYRVLERLTDFTLVEAYPKTGRTHQIRVHFASLGHPLAGDGVYGGHDIGLGRHFLHAGALGFRLPGDGRYVEHSAHLPPELTQVLASLQGGSQLSATTASRSARLAPERS